MGWPTILVAQQGDSLAEGGLALPVDTVDMSVERIGLIDIEGCAGVIGGGQGTRTS